MANGRHQMKKAMAALTFMMIVFIAVGALPLLFLRGVQGNAFLFLCFPAVGMSLAAVRHVLKAIDRRLTALEQGNSDE